MGRKENKANSVLKRQKPKNRSQRKLLKGGLTSALSGILIASGIFLWLSPQPETLAPEFLTKKNHPPKKRSSIPWRIDIKNEGSHELEESLVIKIRSTLATELEAHTKSFQNLANLVRKMGSFTVVRLAQTSDQTLVLQVTPRVPSLCIEADQLRFVDQSANVYGTPNTTDECPSPALKGLFDASRKYTINDDATLELNSAEQSVIRDTLLLRNSLASFDLQPTSLQYTKHRGFTVTLKGKIPEITLGYPPFETRIEKLVSLLSKLASRGEEALRIELDYQGKAFLKLKKI